MENILTKQKLMDMPDGDVFGVGVGTFPEINNKLMIKWVAVRGLGYFDWCIYYDISIYSIDYIKRKGDKMFRKSVIEKLIPCDNDAWGLYRF